jgi:hypothetical protein
MAAKDERVYLNDHRAAADVALRVVGHLQRRRAGDEVKRVLDWFEREVVSDRDSLDHVMRRLDVPHNRVKHLGARVAGSAGLAKLTTRMAGSEAAVLLLGFEMLALGVQGKVALWRSLRVADDPRLTGIDLASLIDRGLHQFDALEAQRQRAAAQALDARAGKPSPAVVPNVGATP